MVMSAMAAGATKSAMDRMLSEPGQKFKAGDVAGIGSAMGGSKEIAQTPQVPEVSGSESSKYLTQATDAAFSKGINSVLNPRMSAKDAGKYQKDYLASAFPEMNPWERAGASATQAGVQAGQQQSQKQLMQMQMDNQKDLAKIQSDTAKDVAVINNKASMEKLDLEKMVLASKNVLTQYQSSTEAWKAVSEELRSKNIPLEGDKLRAMVPQIQALTEKLQTGNSDYGRTYTDVRNMLRNGTNLKGGELETAAQTIAAAMYAGEKVYDKLPSFGKKAGGLGSSVRQGSTPHKSRRHTNKRPDDYWDGFVYKDKGGFFGKPMNPKTGE